MEFCSGGFGDRGIEGKMAADTLEPQAFHFWGFVRLQVATIEFCRNALN